MFSVKSAKTSYVNQKVEVEFDEGKVTVGKMVEKIEAPMT